MPAMLEVPRDFVEAVAHLRLPPRADRNLQRLMDRNTEGSLTPTEREDLQALVEWGEHLALVRTHALRLLGRNPG